MRVSPAWHGEVDAFIPIADWGIRANAFSAPVELHVEPRSVDRDAVVRAASGDAAVLTNAEADARRAARRALIRAWLWSVAGALALGVVAALLARTLGRRSTVETIAWALAPAALAATVSLVVLLRVQHTFHPQAFASPSFYARGAELGQLLEVAEEAQTIEGGYRSSVQRTLAGYATLLNAGANLTPVATEPPAVLLSDLHGNKLVLGPLKRLFSGSPIYFAGDFGQRGSPAEARALVPQVKALGSPLVAVSGNHDSRYFMRRLAQAGVVVLTERGRLLASGKTDGRPVQRIAGLRTAGFSDPLEWRGSDPGDPRRVFSFSERPDGDREYARAERELLRWFQGLRPSPQVVLIHENGLAQSLARTLRMRGYERPLLILTGHDHKQHIDRYGEIVVVDGGTVGAGGVFGVASQSVGVAQLHVPKDSVVPRAVDLVTVEPISGAATADRLIVHSPSACEDERMRCHDGDDPDQ
jgi:predicted phosphodiesterase